MIARRLALLGLAAWTPSAAAQSFNIDFGQPSSGPPASYGAAGAHGFWNVLQAPHTSASTSPQAFDEMLSDLAGNPTGVGVHQFGGTELIDVLPTGAGAPTSDDATLLRDAIVNHQLNLQSCLYINGLQNGTYEVLTYAWYPDQPQVLSEVHFDFTPGVATVGGAWTGQHAEGVTFARHVVQVSNGFMGPHAGFAPGGDPVLGGPLNAIQLRLLGEPTTYCTGKTNSLGCLPFLTASGYPSVTDSSVFSIQANRLVAGQIGYALYSFKKAGLGFHGGTLCVKAPFTRWLPGKAAQDGGGFPCPGTSKRNFNNRIQGGADPLLTVGAGVSVQWYQRDPDDPAGFGDGLTDAVRFTIGP